MRSGDIIFSTSVISKPYWNQISSSITFEQRFAQTCFAQTFSNLVCCLHQLYQPGIRQLSWTIFRATKYFFSNLTYATDEMIEDNLMPFIYALQPKMRTNNQTIFSCVDQFDPKITSILRLLF